MEVPKVTHKQLCPLPLIVVVGLGYYTSTVHTNLDISIIPGDLVQSCGPHLHETTSTDGVITAIDFSVNLFLAPTFVLYGLGDETDEGMAWCDLLVSTATSSLPR